jgi:ribose-phosphate pyrophosphokinase
MDLHSPQIQGFFSVPVDHLYARHVISRHIQSLNIPDLVVCSPDVGFAKGASAYANILGVPVVIGNKQRVDHSEMPEVLEVIGDVRGRNVIMVDDFAITGRSLINMAEVLRARGAKDIYAAVSHGVLSKGAAERIGESLIRKMFITDTVETPIDPLPANVDVVTVAPLFAQAIRSIHDRSSISMLFPEDKAGE